MDIQIRKQLEQLEYIKDKLEYIEYDEALGCYIEKQDGLPTGVAAWVNGAFYGFEQAAKAQAVQQWISVQDRMPEQGQKVLVFRPDAHNHPHKDPNFKICTYAGADIFINSHFEHVITHWKPLESPIEAQEPAND